MVSRHRTMPVTCSTSRALISSGSADRRGQHIGDRAEPQGALIVTSASASRIASAAGCISAQWNGALTGSSTARRAPNFGASATARSIAVLVPRDHHLARRIVVGGFAYFALGGGLGQLLRLAEIGAEQRRHGALADRHRLLHGPAAHLEQPRGIGEAERAGGRERRIFARANGRRRKRRLPGSLSPLSPSTRMAASDTAISAGCAFSVSVSSASGPSHISRERFCDKRRIDLLEHRARRRISLGKLRPHADGLASLPGKDESDAHGPRIAR